MTNPDDINQWRRAMGKVEAAVKAERHRPWHELPTVARLARKLRCRQSVIRDLVEDSDNLDLIVGVRTGRGAGELAHGDQRVEWAGE